MAIEIRPVASRRDILDFIELPFRLHASSPWVPPLRVERQAFLSRRFNAFYRHGDARLFLARRDGRVVGRISAQVDAAWDAAQGPGTGMFGFLELEDDPEVARRLLGAAAGWLRARGRTRLLGPMDFTLNDESGVLVDGFERPPMIRQPWHPPYYRERLEELGLSKAMDLLMWQLHVSDRAKVLPVIFELAEALEPKHGIRIRHATRRSLRADLDRFGEIWNTAWRDNWGFTPYGKADLDALALETQLVFDRHWFMVAETAGGETAGVAITVPDVNQVLARMNGRVLPTGWWHFLRKGRTVDRVRVGFLGVKPELQHAGVAAGLYAEHFAMAQRRPQTGGEMGWILESNTAMNRGMEAMGGTIVKRFRLYERDLADLGSPAA